MLRKYNTIINGCCEKSILIDTTLFDKINKKNVVIFSHGFKGFKDWGPFNKIAEHFAVNGFVFVKFNFSHNGTSIEKPNDFVDLSAFGNNNFCKELDDLGLVINWVINEFPNYDISLFGHSRGGAISMLKSKEENRIANIVSWASPSDLLSKLPNHEKASKWKKNNISYIFNSRTKQNMPLYYQFYENCLANKSRLDIKNAVSNMKIPHLHVHGNADSTVSIDDAYNIKTWNPKVHLHVIKDADHVFSTCHPYSLIHFPSPLMEAIDKTIKFLKN